MRWQRPILALTVGLAVCTTTLFSSSESFAQSVAQSVAFTSATSTSPAEAYKIPHGTFIPFFPKTSEPTTFYISDDDRKYVAVLVLPKGSPFGGTQFNDPEVRGWVFPKAEGEITIVIGNNLTTTTRRIAISTWINPTKKGEEPAKPVCTGTVFLDILPKPGSVPVPNPIPGPDDGKPVPKPPVPPEPITYKGKALLCVFEETANATKQRGDFFASKELRAFLGEKLVEHPRVIDETNIPNDLKAYYQLYKDSGSKLPYYFLLAATTEGTITPGTILKQGTIPQNMTPTEFIQALK